MKRLFGTLAALVMLSTGYSAPLRAEVQISSTHFGVLTYGIPLAVALSEGYFKDAGVEVTGILSGKGGATAVRNALASDFKYGEAGLPAVLAARRAGVDLVIVNVATASHGDVAWVARKNSEFTSLESLRGRKVTYTNPKSGSESNMLEIVRLTGVEVDMVAAGGMREGLTMVATGDAAAAPMVEPMMTMQADKFDVVFRVSDYLPRMTTIVGFVPRDFAEANADALRAIIEARRKAVRLMRDDPAAAAKAATAGGYRYPPEVLESVIRRLSDDGYWSEGAIDIAGLEPNVPMLKTVGAIDGDSVAWSELVVTDYLPADLRP